MITAVRIVLAVNGQAKNAFLSDGLSVYFVLARFPPLGTAWLASALSALLKISVRSSCRRMIRTRGAFDGAKAATSLRVRSGRLKMTGRSHR